MINLKVAKKNESKGSSASSTERFKSADCKAILFNCMKKLEVKVKGIFDLGNPTNKNQIKGEQQLKCLMKLVELD